MAEDDKKTDGEEGEKGSGKKGLIIMIVVVIIAIGASVGVTLFLLGGDDSAENAAAEPVEEVKAPSIYFDLKPALLTTFNIDGRQRYMQAHLSVSSRDQATIDAFEHHLPLIKSRINGLYSQQDFVEMQSDEGRLKLKESTLSLINEVLTAEGESEIENVYFTNFVMQ